jgi:hypothetical protein
VALRTALLTDLEIRDERDLRHLPLYARLKQRLIDDRYPFALAAADGDTEDWARVLFLNLTYWRTSEGRDVLAEPALAADVVAHVAWHHTIGRALDDGTEPPSVDALVFAEAVASAFDVYLLGQVMGRTRRSGFADTAVPAITEVALGAGLSEEEVDALFASVVDDPEAAFASLRALLFDVTTALVRCATADDAVVVFDAVRDHPFMPVLHHYELSNWVLHARVYGGAREPDPRVRALDADLRASPHPLDWLERWCLGPPAAGGVPEID